MTDATMTCGFDSRRQALFGNADWNGIDYLEVSADQLSLDVYFFGAVPTNLRAANVRIDGGRRVTGIRVVAIAVVDADGDGDAVIGCLRVALDRYGDFSTYTLALVESFTDAQDSTGLRTLSGFDARYASIDFTFKTGCPSDVDCASARVCPPEPAVVPDINYLAKDYASFRQLMLDRLAVTMPDWHERHVPDLGITLVELLAYVADQLSWQQDAVATEAYLDTARLRISVRRHARLVDYRLHEGCNARAWLTIACTAPVTLTAGSCYFVTGEESLQALANGQTLRHTDLASIASESFEVFEPVTFPAGADVVLHPELSTLQFHTWGDRDCCLPKGATRATLIAPAATPSTSGGQGTRDARTHDAAADRPSLKPPTSSPTVDDATTVALAPGDVLIFEEVLGPTTGNAADADPAHRCAVRLTAVTATTDPLLDIAVIEIEWSPLDALPFALCLSARLPAPDCRHIGGISVARGNVVLVDHGTWVEESLGVVDAAGSHACCGCEGTVLDTIERASAFSPVLARAPLTHAEPASPNAPASTALDQDPRAALAQLALVASGNDTPPTTTTWSIRADLLASDGDDRTAVVEVDDAGRGHLRFGDGRLGRAPDAGSTFSARYRIGSGAGGNVPAESISFLVFRDARIEGADLAPRNPLAARGGTPPETLAEAKLAAPHAFRNRLARAITPADYAELAQRNPALQRANATLAWTGSWYEARVAIDPLGTETATADLCNDIDAALEPFRRVGHDLAVRPARYVPLVIALQVCVMSDVLQAHVAVAVAAALGNRRLADGTPGFFHPDRLSFGDAIHASDLIATVQNIEGVQSVQVIELRRADAPKTPLPPGTIELAPFEIAQLDNDPDYPEHGTLVLCMGGGR